MIHQTVFGLGTGRCGSTSLASLLNLQAGAHVTHERRSYRWVGSEAAVLQVMSQLQRDPAWLVGDVCGTYLPYVSLLLQQEPTAKFVCLQRDKQKTVASALSANPDRNFWEPGKRNLAAPQYDEKDSAKAMGLYWEDYYRQAADLASKLPQSVRLFPTELLNSEDGQRAILDFVGVPRDRQWLQAGIRLNIRLRQ